MSFFKLRECDILTSFYTAYPSYSYEMTNLVSDFEYIFRSSSVGKNRSFADVDGRPITGSYNLSGAVSFLTSSLLSSSHRYAANRLRNIYASGTFSKIDNYTSSSVFSASTPSGQTMHLLNIPSVLYGNEVKPGSFTLKTNGNHEYSDDIYGGIFTGTTLIGCMFYQHGIAYFGHNFSASGDHVTGVTASFSGTNRIPMNMYVCRVPRGELNFSTNASYTQFQTSSNANVITTKRPKTFVTGIGLYDENYKLVGVAKVSSPILNDEDSSLLFKLKLNY